MKLPVIRKIVKQYSLEELQAAEQDLLEEKPLNIEVEGEDEGEQLTHIIGAIEIKQNVANGMSDKDALRAFSKRVRDSIS
jgi:hypothetical protein